MKIKEKGKGLAIFAMILMILVSVPVGHCVDLSRTRGQIADAFYGTEEDWGLADSLNSMGLAAQDLVSVSRKYLPANQPEIAELAAAREKVAVAMTPGERYSAYRALSRCFHTLNGVLSAEIIKNREDANFLKETQEWFLMEEDAVSRNAYNTEAVRFNQLLEQSPLRPLAELVGVHPLELFQ